MQSDDHVCEQRCRGNGDCASGSFEAGVSDAIVTVDAKIHFKLVAA